jgi:hypothetical protein
MTEERLAAGAGFEPVTSGCKKFWCHIRRFLPEIQAFENLEIILLSKTNKHEYNG